MSKKLRKLRKFVQGRVYDLHNEQHHPEEISSFIQCHFPCVIRNSMQSWPAFHLWRPPFHRLIELIKFTSAIKVAVSSTSFSGLNTSYIEMTFLEFLSRPIDPSFSLYMAQCPIRNNSGLEEENALSALQLDLHKPRYLESKEFSIFLWMNTGKVVSDFHYDSYQGLLCVVSGMKTVELIPPSKCLSCYPLDIEAYNHTPLELTGEFFVTLGPGDVLFIPEGWWHRVTSEEYTVAVSFVWDGVDQRILVKGTIYSDTSGELDFYVVRNAMKRLAIKEIQKTIEEKAKSFHIDDSTLKHIREGDSEFISEQISLSGTLPVLFVRNKQHAPASSVKRMLSKMRKYGGLIDFILKLTPEEGFLVAQKLDECDDLGISDFCNILADGSALSRKFQRILMKKRQKTLRKAIDELTLRIF